MAIATRIDALRTLGLTPTASEEDVKNAYKKLSKRYHPDVVGDRYTDTFIEISEAYEFLINNPPPERKVLGNDEGAMVRYASRRTNRDMARKYEFNEKKRRREKEEALRRASLEARRKQEEEKRRLEEIEQEKQRQIRAMEMAIVISKMLKEENK